MSEEASNGLLMLLGQYFGIIFTFVIQDLLVLRTNWWQPGPFHESVFSPASLFIGVTITLVFIIIIFFKVPACLLACLPACLPASQMMLRTYVRVSCLPFCCGCCRCWWLGLRLCVLFWAHHDHLIA